MKSGDAGAAASPGRQDRPLPGNRFPARCGWSTAGQCRRNGRVCRRWASTPATPRPSRTPFPPDDRPVRRARRRTAPQARYGDRSAATSGSSPNAGRRWKRRSGSRSSARRFPGTPRTARCDSQLPARCGSRWTGSRRRCRRSTIRGSGRCRILALRPRCLRDRAGYSGFRRSGSWDVNPHCSGDARARLMNRRQLELQGQCTDGRSLREKTGRRIPSTTVRHGAGRPRVDGRVVSLPSTLDVGSWHRKWALAKTASRGPDPASLLR